MWRRLRSSSASATIPSGTEPAIRTASGRRQWPACRRSRIARRAAPDAGGQTGHGLGSSDLRRQRQRTFPASASRAGLAATTDTRFTSLSDRLSSPRDFLGGEGLGKFAGRIVPRSVENGEKRSGFATPTEGGFTLAVDAILPPLIFLTGAPPAIFWGVASGLAAVSLALFQARSALKPLMPTPAPTP